MKIVLLFLLFFPSIRSSQMCSRTCVTEDYRTPRKRLSMGHSRTRVTEDSRTPRKRLSSTKPLGTLIAFGKIADKRRVHQDYGMSTGNVNKVDEGVILR